MTLIQAVGAAPASSSTPAITFAAIGSGHFGFATIRMASGISITSAIDNQGNVWTVSTPYSGGTGGQNAFAYRANITNAPTSLTWTLASASTTFLTAQEFDDVITASPIDQTSAGATGTGTAIASDSITTTHAAELLLGVCSAAGTDTPFVQSGSWLIASGTGAPTARSVVVYQYVTSTGTFNAAVTGNTSLVWLAQTVSFQVQSTGSSIVGRQGLRATDDATKTTSNALVGRVGVRAVDAAAKTTSNSVVGRLGLRSTNSASLGSSGSSLIGRVGLRATNDAGKSTFELTVGGLGVRSTNTVNVTHQLDHIARMGVRSTNAVAAPVGSSIGRVGVRGVNSYTMTRNVDSVARLGVRSVADTGRIMSVNTIGRAGGRSRNTYTPGTLPLPTVAPAANNSTCASDWTLVPTVTWPDPSTLVGCAPPAGSFTE